MQKLAYKNNFVDRTSFSCQWFHAKTRFDTEAKGDSINPSPTFRLSVHVTRFKVLPQDKLNGSTDGEDVLSVTFDSYQDKK